MLYHYIYVLYVSPSIPSTIISVVFSSCLKRHVQQAPIFVVCALTGLGLLVFAVQLLRRLRWPSRDAARTMMIRAPLLRSPFLLEVYHLKQDTVCVCVCVHWDATGYCSWSTPGNKSLNLSQVCSVVQSSQALAAHVEE